MISFFLINTKKPRVKGLLKVSLLSIAVSIIFSCNQNQTNHIQFVNKVKVEGESILQNDFSLIAVRLIGDSLVLTERLTTPFYNVYNSKTLDKVTSFGERGAAPNEFFMPLLLNSPKSESNNEKLLWIVDPVKKKAGFIELDIILSNSIIKYVRQEDIPNNYIPVIWISLNKDIHIGFDQFNHIVIYNNATSTGTTKEGFILLDGVTIIDNAYRNSFYYLNTTFNFEKRIIACVSENIPQINFFNFNHEKGSESIVFNKTIFTGKPPQNIVDIDIENGAFERINTSVTSTKEYIYILNVNQISKEYQKVPKGVDVLIIDWEGNPVLRLEIDEYLHFITVDEQNEFLYGIDYTEDKAYRYRIGKIMNHS